MRWRPRLPRLRLPQVWTASQRRVVLGFAIALLTILAVEHWLNPINIDDPQPPRAARYEELADRIDPNVADVDALSALPTLGEKRAKSIIDYREEFVRRHPGKRAFESARDLLKLKGFGAAMVANLEPYLIFETPATNPAR
jgi:DNA uptake protein ComE-like DNA-binding protein